MAYIENMPKGPQGQKRPADAIARAVMVARIATGELDDAAKTEKKARAEGRKAGGTARANSLTPEQRKEIARLAADARWKKG
jgi:autonomous glycyl radical cofactor GrcA